MANPTPGTPPAGAGTASAGEVFYLPSSIPADSTENQTDSQRFVGGGSPAGTSVVTHILKKITPRGNTGSITFTNGKQTAYTAAT